uniref:TNFR-Cys domain-containing protein n=1 Tax=Mucochytrium quahogii TaxID=96639 RepID=A0A7S2S883_9STRA|mmetsp:Transcript_41020/g.65985  ORF Transcript_41020/g.65985 Transcript_41020/m.65985 type:complete len:1048 (-) Transcript_41020:3838-6981(-)
MNRIPGLLWLVGLHEICRGTSQSELLSKQDFEPFPRLSDLFYIKSHHQYNQTTKKIELVQKSEYAYRTLTFRNYGETDAFLGAQVESDGDWLGVEYEKQEGFLFVPRTKRGASLNLTIDPSILPAGTYKGVVTLTFLTTSFKEAFTLTDVVVLNLDAPPDYSTTTTNFSSCLQMNFSDTCSGTIILRDVDGFPVSPRASANTITGVLYDPISGLKEPIEFASKFQNSESTEGAESSSSSVSTSSATTTEQLGAILRGFRVGQLVPQVAVFNANVTMDNVSISVSCGPNRVLSANGKSCNCADGFFEETSKGERVCSRCKACPAGDIVTTGAVTCSCSACPQGKYCSDQFSSEQCPVGHFCPARSVAPQACPLDTFQDEVGQSSCTPCNLVKKGSSTFNYTGASSIAMCTTCARFGVCDGKELYAYSANVSCPPNTLYSVAASAGVDQSPLRYVSYPEAGYYRYPSLKQLGLDANHPCVSVSFYPCPLAGDKTLQLTDSGNTNICPGGTDTQTTSACTAGHDGFACQSCAVGYARSGGLECKSCSETGPYVMAIVAAVLLFFLTGYLTLTTIRKRSLELSSTKKISKKTPVPGDVVVSVLKIAYSHFQVIALLLSLDVDWHPSVAVIEKFAATITISGSDVTSSVTCLFNKDDTSETPGFYMKVILVYMYPVICAAGFAVIWFLLAIFGRCNLKKWWNYVHGFQLSVIIMLFLAHIILVRTALELLVCSSPKIQDQMFLVADPRIVCFDSQHMAWFLAAGVGGIIAYGMGIPLISALSVKRGKNQYLTKFLCKNFKRRFNFWESIVAARKVSLTIFVITLDKFGPNAQGVSCLIVLFVALTLQVHFNPFTYPFLNQLEFCGLVTAIATLTFAMYSISFDTEADRSFNILIALCNLAFIVFVLYEILMLCCAAIAGNTKILTGKRRTSDEHVKEEEQEEEKARSFNKQMTITTEVEGDDNAKSFIIDDTNDELDKYSARTKLPTKILPSPRKAVPKATDTDPLIATAVEGSRSPREYRPSSRSTISANPSIHIGDSDSDSSGPNEIELL